MENIEYYENGQIKSRKFLNKYGDSVYEKFSLNGKLIKCIEYLTTGEKRKETTYNENGQKKREIMYRNEMMVKEIEYYSNGERKTETSISPNGEKRYIEFYPNGQAKIGQLFKNGVCIEQMRYSEDGTKDKVDVAVIITKKVAKTVFKIGKVIGKSLLEQAAKRK